MTMNVDKFLDLLVCPESHASLVHAEGALVSTDPGTRRRYSIIDGIPVMLIDESEQLSDEEWQAIMRRNGRDPITGQPT